MEITPVAVSAAGTLSLLLFLPVGYIPYPTAAPVQNYLRM